MNILSEIRYGLRALLKNRGFTAIAAVTLGICIAANAAIFSMADAAFRPFPFKDLDHVLAVSESIPQVSAERYDVSAGNYFDWKQQSRAVEQMEAYKAWRVTLTDGNEGEAVQGYLVSPGFFSLLGVAPVKGRVFSAYEYGVEKSAIVVSHHFWQQRLGSDPSALGRPVKLNGLDYTIVGVMPKEFEFPLYAELWAPWVPTLAERNERMRRELGVIARLKWGLAVAEAQAEMNHIAEALARDYPMANAGRGAKVVSLSEAADPYARRFMAVLFCAVAFLLLLACANVANLQLARGTARRKEIAVRLAIGGSRAGIARQLFIEGFLLSSLGGAIGLPLATTILSVIKANIPQIVAQNAPYLMHVHLDLRMLLFVLVVVVVTTSATTLSVALQGSPQHLAETLKENGRGSMGPSRSKLRSGLVIAEVALAIVLLIGSGLMVNGFRQLAATNVGIDPRNVLTFGVGLPETEYPSNDQAENFYKEALRRFSAISEVESAAVVSELPALGDSRSSPVIIEGQAQDRRERPLLAEIRVVSEDYFRTLGIPIREGRGLTAHDGEGALPVAVVNQAAAHRFWRGQGALGHRLKLTSPEMQTPWLTVVGSVGDVNHFYLDSEIRPTIYLSYVQKPVRALHFVMRSSAPFAATALQIRQAVRSVDAKQQAYDLQSLHRFFTDLAGAVGIMTWLMSGFAFVALALSAAGVYALMAYSVVQRRQEIGIRMALGAESKHVRKLIVGDAVQLVAIGLAIALPAALGLGRVMISAMSGIVALDLVTFAAFAGGPAAIALLGAYIPARRATKIDPLTALRLE